MVVYLHLQRCVAEVSKEYYTFLSKSIKFYQHFFLGYNQAEPLKFIQGYYNSLEMKLYYKILIVLWIGVLKTLLVLQ